MAGTFDIAVVGADTLVGEAVLDLLAQRGFPVGRAYALSAGSGMAEDATEVAFGKRSLPVQDVAGFDFTRVKLAFFAARAEVAACYVPQAVAAGCVVVDDSTYFRQDDDVPLVVASVNLHAIGHYRQRSIVASPGSNVTQLLSALFPLHRVATLTRINIATYQAVSGSGREGIDELAQQTAQLLNGRPVKSSVYSGQIAFNVLPAIDILQDNGYTLEEMKLVWETRKVLETPTLAVNATTVRVPVFFGHSQVVNIETQHKLTARQAIEILANTPGVKVVDEEGDTDLPTPVTSAVQSEAVYVGRIRDDLSHPRGLNLWVVADNVRTGAALNSVQIAESLIGSLLPGG